MRTIFIVLLASITLSFFGCSGRSGRIVSETKASEFWSTEVTQGQASSLSSKLPAEEIKQRKAVVLECLRSQVLETVELETGYAFKFIGTDKKIDELMEFIKTERLYCSFFTFNLSISGDKSFVWLELIGPEEAKAFIKSELEL